MTFLEKLRLRWQTSQSLLCVGLDPDPARMPSSLAGSPQAIARFCCDIVDATAAHVCAFKPQIAYFAACGAEDQLQMVLDHIRARHGDIPIVLDAKRGDIGPTATQYAREAFDRYGADAVTINPYMGTDSVSPYLAWTDRAVFVLCRTSNPGGDDLQSLTIAGTHPAQAVYERVAEMSAGSWNAGAQVGLVVGATYPAELARVRALAPDLPLLVPGIGAQGGDIEATVAAGLDARGAGLLINSSRAILYAGGTTDHAEAAGRAARETATAIEAARRLVLQQRA